MKALKFYLIVFCLFFPTSLIAQTILIGKVVDTETKKGIENANIHLLEDNKGLTSNKAGYVIFPYFTDFIEIEVSHLSYQSRKFRINSTIYSDTLYLYLKPKVELLESFTVSADKIQGLSDREAYSVVDFEIMDDYITRLEYHGSFKNYKLSISDLDGKVLHELPLRGVKQVESLHNACDEILYLVTSSKTYPITWDRNIELGQYLTRKEFNKFVLPCKASYGILLYYVQEDYNGLKTTIKSFNKLSREVQIVKVIADEKRIAHYKEDQKRILDAARGKSKVRINGAAELRRMRDLQNEAVFIKKIFYKPEYPIYLFAQNNQLELFNHPHLEIEVTTDFEVWEKVADVNYLPNKKWTKQLVNDPITTEKYNVFEDAKGMRIERINMQTGQSKLVDRVDVHAQKIRKIRAYNNELYFLKEVAMNSRKIELVKQKL